MKTKERLGRLKRWAIRLALKTTEAAAVAATTTVVKRLVENLI